MFRKQRNEITGHSNFSCYGVNWDENFAYIAGRTEAGFPYDVVTWEELAESGLRLRS
jgi:hypothetical protein